MLDKGALGFKMTKFKSILVEIILLIFKHVHTEMTVGYLS